MRRFAFWLACFCQVLLPGLPAHADMEYRKAMTSQGQVVLDIDRETALKKFGLPASVTENIWQYSGQDKFFVYFPSSRLVSLFLYPRISEAGSGIPLEFKVFGYFSDSKVKDLTDKVEYLFSEPRNFFPFRPGVFMSAEAGDFQVMAKYEGILSNPGILRIKEAKEKKDSKEKLLAIDVLPFNPRVPPDSRLSFIALGTFLDPASSSYSVRDISSKVSWYIRSDKGAQESRGNQIYFPVAGKFSVFCRYQGLESYAQPVNALENPGKFTQTLKHITVLPESIFANAGAELELKAFATYHSNRVDEITSKAAWKSSHKAIVSPKGPGRFLPNSEGIAEITAESTGIESIPAKVIVTKSKRIPSQQLAYDKSKEKDIRSEELVKDIKKNLEKLSENIFEKQKSLRLIKIIPESAKLSLGETKQLAAQGVFSDGSQTDLTLLGEWASSNTNVAGVSRGLVRARSSGEAKVYIKFKDTVSLPATITVEGPKLISIILSPKFSEISMKDSFTLKAEGYFSDSSRKDVTDKVSWEIDGPRLVKIERGKVRPQKTGKTRVYAEYMGIKSLPVDISIIFSGSWFLYSAVKRLLFVIVCLAGAFVLMSVLARRERDKLLSYLDTDPRRFIISLYDNAHKVLAVFGQGPREIILPLAFARIIQQKYSVRENLFLRFTQKFEEAKYSSHPVTRSGAVSAMEDYNRFMDVAVKHYGRVSLSLKYFRLLFSRRPLFIS